jgi:hypothetical protein
MTAKHVLFAGTAALALLVASALLQAQTIGRDVGR